jgi:hypothetical protein
MCRPPSGLSKGSTTDKSRTSEKGHVWTAPTGQGIFGFLLAVGCKSCVRPVCAVLMTAGPDVIRRSGPYQNLALDRA